MQTDKVIDISYSLDLKLKIIKELNFELNHNSVILDFGCGDGKSVQELREKGFNAFGCDIMTNYEKDVKIVVLVKENIIRVIEFEPYVLPFEDNTFDFIFSNSVFEHVKNYSETISELSRVLKRGGFCLHTFASRYNPIEVHIFVPFAPIIQNYYWFYLWTLLGVRNEWQDCKTPKERAIRFYNYLKNKTNYLSKKQLKNQFDHYFSEVIFCEKEFLKFSERGKFLFMFSKIFPFIVPIYSTFRSRVVMTRLPRKQS